MNIEEVQTSAITAVEGLPLSPADHSFTRGYDWSQDAGMPRVKVVSTFYSTLIVPRKTEL